MSVSGVCCGCCGLWDVSKHGWLNLLSFLSSVPLRWRKDLCETWWWIDIRVFWLASFVHYGSEILSASSQCFWVIVGKRWPLFNRCHQLLAASPWHPCYMCSGWRLFLKNCCWCKGLLLSTVAQKYWVLKLTMFLSDSRQEVAFVYDDGVCVFQLAYGRLQRTNLNIPKVLEKLNGVLGSSLSPSYWLLHIKGFGNW